MTETMRELVFKEIKSGREVKAIAEEYGVSVFTVYTMKRKLKIAGELETEEAENEEDDYLDGDAKQRIREFKEGGMNAEEIAQETGIPITAVRKVLGK